MIVSVGNLCNICRVPDWPSFPDHECPQYSTGIKSLSRAHLPAHFPFGSQNISLFAFALKDELLLMKWDIYLHIKRLVESPSDKILQKHS
jgi:hypothetical protein